MALNIGDKIPSFEGVNDQGESFSSDDLLGKKPFVIYFYPKNFTPGCTKEACDFRDHYEDFKDLGAEVIGVSADSVSSHKRFKNKHQLPFVFLSDKNGKLRKKFQVASLFFGMLSGRETFVVDQQGILQMRFNSINASKHMQKAIQTIKNMSHNG